MSRGLTQQLGSALVQHKHLPVEQVISSRSSAARCRRVSLKVLQHLKLRKLSSELGSMARQLSRQDSSYPGVAHLQLLVNSF